MLEGEGSFWFPEMQEGDNGARMGGGAALFQMNGEFDDKLKQLVFSSFLL